MIYLYDKALVSKFEKVFDKERVIYAPVDKFYERYEMGVEGRDISPVKLPAISIWRTSHEFKPYTAPTQLRIPNFRKKLESDPLLARQIYSMEIHLEYQLDIWASSDIDRDDMMKEILYFLVMYPDIYIEYQGEKFTFPVYIQPPDDTTDIANFDSTGDLYRITIPLSIPDARLLFYQDAKLAKYIKVDYYVNDNLDSTTQVVPDNKE